MSDDIVKYLRLTRTRFNRHAEAADEIERLQADRDKWQQVAWLGHKVIFSKWEYTQFEQAYENAFEAVRGDE